jgi:CrcB protein
MTDPRLLLAVALGGAIGAVGRFLVAGTLHAWLGRGFPYGTLAVNVIGSFLIGLLTVLALERLTWGPEWRAAIFVGVLGSFTTFSTFSLETLNLLGAGQLYRALWTIGLNLGGCLAATAVGLWLGRQLTA